MAPEPQADPSPLPVEPEKPRAPLEIAWSGGVEIEVAKGPGSADYIPKEDINLHPAFPDEINDPDHLIVGDSLGASYIRTGTKNRPKFLLTRWHVGKFPVTFQPAPDFPAEYIGQIKRIMDHLNQVARDLHITPDGKPMLQLGAAEECPPEDEATHTLRFTMTVDKGPFVSRTRAAVVPETGEILDTDIEIDFKRLQSLYQNGDLQKRVRRLVMHELLHALGLSDNFLGTQYRSLMAPVLSDQKLPEYPELSDERGKDYDRQVLFYLYSKEDCGPLPEFELIRVPLAAAEVKPEENRISATPVEPILLGEKRITLSLDEKDVINLTDLYNRCLEWHLSIVSDMFTVSEENTCPDEQACFDYLRKTLKVDEKSRAGAMIKKVLETKHNLSTNDPKTIEAFRNQEDPPPNWILPMERDRAMWYYFIKSEMDKNKLPSEEYLRIRQDTDPYYKSFMNALHGPPEERDRIANLPSPPACKWCP